MFIDNARIHIKSGSGGKGCDSFYTDKYIRGKKMPDGGNGGRGADIIIRADHGIRTLLDFQYNRHFTGSNGTHGSSKNKKGKDAPAVIIKVPCGTVIKDVHTGCTLRDLSHDKEELIAAAGGRGGMGNRHHKQASGGEAGEERELILDLKLIADVGVIGFPNVGKSTLISAVSNARPKIAAYPFTTKSPFLGVVHHGESSFVIADIPGLIEGSAEGRGLGQKFLRHIERTRVLLHVIDAAGFEGRDPLEDYRIINNELKKYKDEIARKPQVLAANKMDLEGAEENLARFKAALKKKVYPISALRKEGLEDLIEGIAKKL
ncbi:MAG: GTPase ObgE [Candidatus Omnitrophota bacterium]